MRKSFDRKTKCSFKIKTFKISADILSLLTSTKNLVETIAIAFLRVSSCKKLLTILSFTHKADKHLCKSWSM